MNASQFIQRIEAAGFHMEVEGDGIAITPASRLTDPQRQFIRAHKVEILAALQAANDAAPGADPIAVDAHHPAPNSPEDAGDPAGLAHAEAIRAAILSGHVYHRGRIMPPGAWEAPQGAPDLEPLPMLAPAPSRAAVPATGSPAARCGDCGNFVRDRIGDGTGLGSCPTVNPPGLLWPGTVRRCPSFKAAGLGSTSNNTLEANQ